MLREHGLDRRVRVHAVEPEREHAGDRLLHVRDARLLHRLDVLVGGEEHEVARAASAQRRHRFGEERIPQRRT
jgi:hypothetical protein